MNIAIDLDEVLADTMSSLIRFHNTTYQTQFKFDDFHSYEWWHIWGGTKKQSIAKFMQFVESSYFPNITPVKGAQKNVFSLAKLHTLHVVTSRQTSLEEATKRWVAIHFPNIFHSLHVTNHPQWALTGKTRTKAEVCKELKIDILIDDSLFYANECVEVDIPVVLFDYPWNKGILPKRTTRVFSWKGAVDVIDRKFSDSP